MMPSERSETDKKGNDNPHDDDHTKSRTRVSRACTRCRTRKDRCDGLRPACTACVNAHQICSYEPSTKKRGLPEGYVRGLEKLFALLVGKVEGFEDLISTLLSKDRHVLSKIWNHPVVGEELHTTWKESRILSELESLLSNLDQPPSGVGNKRKREKEDGEEQLEEIEPDMTYHVKCLASVSGQSQHENGGEATSPIRTTPASLPKQALQLLDQYFAHTNCWFPILRRPDLTRACYEMVRGQAKGTSLLVAPLLWAIFAYARRQLKFSNVIDDEGENSETSSVAEMRATALGLIPIDVNECVLVHAQALLIISLIDIGFAHWKSAWVLVGKAVRITLGCISDSKALDKTGTATLQGCIVLDVAVASHLNCVPHIRRFDVESLPRLAEDGHEEWEPWNGPDGFRGQREPSFAISCFNRLLEISLIVADVLRIHPQAGRTDGSYVQDLLGKLHQLQAAFPGQMPPSSQSPPHQIYLQLSHVSAQLRLVEIPIDSGAGPNERAKLACNVLSLLALCKNMPAIGLAHVPPFLADGFGAALRLAQSAKPVFTSSTGLPSYDDFRQTSQDYIQELSTIWPIFSSLVKELDEVNPASIHTDALYSSPSNMASSEARTTFTGLMSNDGETSWNSLSNPMAKGLIKKPSVGLDGNQNLWSAGGTTIQPMLANINQTSIHPRQSSVPHANRFQKSFDLGIVNNTPPGHLDATFVDASPSFHGDEIDAIFHEMAHLDTNEWTIERATGLRDFGFDDDMTFQAFCNDPDRLLGTDSIPPTLSSNLQSWMFAGDPTQPPG